MTSLTTVPGQVARKPTPCHRSETSETSHIRIDDPIDKLPVELWIEVFRNISDSSTLARIMQVNRQLRATVEEQLYRSVDLTGQDQFTKFRLSLTSCPRRASLVKAIRLSYLAEKDPDMPEIFPALLQSLRNLHKLSVEWKQRFGPGTVCCDAVSCVQFSHLRSLRILTRPDPDRFLRFLAAHATHLEEYETTYTYLFEEPPFVDRLASITFPALRVLECTSFFLGGHERLPVPPNLTHLYRPAFRGSQLVRIAERLGAQLVSLRLGDRVQEDRETLPWTLRDVRARFLRLRYLQVDMAFNRGRRIPTDVIDWFSPTVTYGDRDTKTSPNLGVLPQLRSKITIAWVSVSHVPRRNAEWEQFVDREAIRVLTASYDYVERVLHKLSQWISVRLTVSEVRGERKVLTEEMGDMERYWTRA